MYSKQLQQNVQLEQRPATVRRLAPNKTHTRQSTAERSIDCDILTNRQLRS